jgi:6-pyruvoyl-tetrahydropterin synthase
MEKYSVELDRAFKFNSSHFVVYDGFSECYYVMDFGDVKEIMIKLCKQLSDVLLLPALNPYMTISQGEKNIDIVTQDGSTFSIPKQDVKITEIEQISAECLAKYLTIKFVEEIKNYQRSAEIDIIKISIKVYEDVDKYAKYTIQY